MIKIYRSYGIDLIITISYFYTLLTSFISFAYIFDSVFIDDTISQWNLLDLLYVIDEGGIV